MKNSSTTYEAMGMAALLPGMQHMLTLMQAEMFRLRQMVTDAQTNHNPSPARKKPPRGTDAYRAYDRQKKRERTAQKQAKKKAMATGPKSYWGKMTAEERSEEMRRRWAKKREDDYNRAYGETEAESKEASANDQPF
jgi:hypothetical protein